MHKRVIQCTCTFNRHSYLKRALGYFMQQDYPGKLVWFIYNTGKYPVVIDESVLADLPSNRQIVIFNNQMDLETAKSYTNVGSKYRDALQIINNTLEYDLIDFLDDDDGAMPNHITEGVRGLERALESNLKAYKPYYSFFRQLDTISLQHNNFEGSIFMLKEHICTTGFTEAAVSYHNGWLHPLYEKKEILIDRSGPSTFIYDWNQDIPVFKLSGGGDTQGNFYNSQNNNTDYNLESLIPADITHIYSQVYSFMPELTYN